MDDAALFATATGTALNGLARAQHLLGRVTATDNPQALLDLRLVPDAFDCAEQIRSVTIFALRCVLPPLERDWSLAVKGKSPDALLAQIEGARAEIAALTPVDFAGMAHKQIAHKAGEAELTQTAQAYILDFAAPNLWFHLSMAYAILRQTGMDIGKHDFDGLHGYPAGFSFI